MIINRSFKDFKFRHRSKKNQIIFTKKKVKNDEEVLNLIDNFLEEKNSFIFESVEKGKIKIVVFKKDGFKFFNSFEIENSSDIVYYILLTLKEQKLEIEKTIIITLFATKNLDFGTRFFDLSTLNPFYWKKELQY